MTLEIGEAKSEVVLKKGFSQVPHFPEERSKLLQSYSSWLWILQPGQSSGFSDACSHHMHKGVWIQGREGEEHRGMRKKECRGVRMRGAGV